MRSANIAYRFDSVGSGVEAAVNSAAGRWNNESIMNFHEVSGSYNVYVYYDPSVPDGRPAQTVFSCSGGYYVGDLAALEVNFSDFSGLGDRDKRYVMNHELGHALGLAHNSRGCDADTGSIMQQSACIFVETAVYPPMPDDISGAAAIY